MKYVVVCYSVHNKEIASYDAFDNEEDAYSFLEKDAQNVLDYANSIKSGIMSTLKKFGL